MRTRLVWFFSLVLWSSVPASVLSGFRGANYIRLTQQLPPAGLYHSTFSPLSYNKTRSHHDASLAQMATNGYNLTRVFLDPGDYKREDSIAGNLATDMLGQVYLDNVADFVKLAWAHRVDVMLTFAGGLPTNRYFSNKLEPRNANVTGTNTFYLHKGAVAAKSDYLRLFIQGMKARLSAAELNTIAVYSLENEAYFDGSSLPFSSDSVQVTTADGRTYNMADKTSREQCADANAVAWANAVASTVFEEHPGALVTVGMFTFQAVGKKGPNGLNPEGKDPRFPFRPASLSRYANLSFLDVHVYPIGKTWNLESDLASSEWANVDTLRTPVMMGEFGAFKKFFSDAPSAAIAMRDLQIASCAQRFHAWLLWTWDSDNTKEQPTLWSMLDDGGAINGVLAPVVRANPCVM